MSIEEARAPRSYAVRRATAEEWQNLRDLRFEALRDPVAHLAFLDRIEDALERPDSFWRDRARTSAEGTSVATFVAADGDGDLAGTVTVLVNQPGEPDYVGETSSEIRAALVGVFVRAEHRGIGVIQQLLAMTEGWLQEIGVHRVRLHVHEENLRAKHAYARYGYVDSGARVEIAGEPHLEMVRELRGR
ncbi:GNAT family N-acetyltransferase [Nocardioides campestrisoli]|uniref:GNAT family N-acetyltransferase n=1 Tax=Nocardioides campestrisoli TaxID=2736757 RepID=UPI001CD417ED|nr:GNAT family N-acetyltransferase [Nocardioides campestrisoli]